MLSDLRESGSIEQDADMVLFLYRPEYYGLTEDEAGRPTAGVGEIIIAKHQNGETGTVPLRFVGNYGQFTDMEDDFSFGGGPSLGYPGSFSSGMATAASFTQPGRHPRHDRRRII